MGRGPKSWRYTLADIARLTGMSVWQVRRRVKAGEFAPGKLESVLRFIGGFRENSAVRAMIERLRQALIDEESDL